MLLRMYLRWADHRGFQAELVEASAGEEAGLKSATFASSRARTPTGSFKAERGVHRPVSSAPSTARTADTAFAQAQAVPLLPDETAVEIDEADLRIDTYRASGAGGQHVNKTDSSSGSPTCPPESSSSARTSARRPRTSRRRSGSSSHASSSCRRRNGRPSWRASEGRRRTSVSGSQIRSYVLHPYQQVKDLRTGHEVGKRPGRARRQPRRVRARVPAAKAAGKAV